ncbi:MAG: hypothetical protein Q4G69_13865 [Planctomycetia bacterium]|nr:hypothetical protein [Planctomycetia bacterium]
MSKIRLSFPLLLQEIDDNLYHGFSPFPAWDAADIYADSPDAFFNKAKELLDNIILEFKEAPWSCVYTPIPADLILANRVPQEPIANRIFCECTLLENDLKLSIPVDYLFWEIPNEARYTVFVPVLSAWLSVSDTPDIEAEIKSQILDRIRIFQRKATETPMFLNFVRVKSSEFRYIDLEVDYPNPSGKKSSSCRAVRDHQHALFHRKRI